MALKSLLKLNGFSPSNVLRSGLASRLPTHTHALSDTDSQSWPNVSSYLDLCDKAGASTTLTFKIHAEQLAMVDSDGHRSLHSGAFDIVFSRGHGTELAASVHVLPKESMPIRLETFDKWW